MTTQQHDVLNWLHRLVLGVQAAEPVALRESFAPDSFEGIFLAPLGVAWASWPAFDAFLSEQLPRLRPGTLYLRMMGRPTVDIAPDHARATLRWQIAFRLPDSREVPTLADCEATLLRQAAGWAATRLHVVAAPHQSMIV